MEELVKARVVSAEEVMLVIFARCLAFDPSTTYFDFLRINV